jgi:hypothetical protein
VAALIAQNRKNVLVVIDPWEVRVAMVAPIATIRLALLRERPTVVAANRIWPWLARTPVEIVPVAAGDLKSSVADLPELRRFAGTKHEKLVADALALADQALTHALNEQIASHNRLRQAPVAATSAEASRDSRGLPVPHGG